MTISNKTQTSQMRKQSAQLRQTDIEEARPSTAKTGKTVKSATAFRTISEVATELDVQQHVLRFWESRFAQIKPLKRGGGRRYYRPEDVELIRRIHHLLYNEGYTIKGVQKLLQGSKSSFMQKTAEMMGVEEAEQAAEAEAPVLNRKQKQELGLLLEDLKSVRKLIK